MTQKPDVNFDPKPFDEEEAALMAAVEQRLEDGPKPVRATSQQVERAQASARVTMHPPKVQITTRLAKQDLSKLKVLAMEQGLPYQTLLASVVHRYVDGRLVDKG